MTEAQIRDRLKQFAEEIAKERRRRFFDTSLFIDGMRDCERGIPHKSGMSKSYDRGYNAQYELEQIRTERTRSHDARTSAKA